MLQQNLQYLQQYLQIMNNEKSEKMTSNVKDDFVSTIVTSKSNIGIQ